MSEKNQSHECLVCGQKFLIKNLIPMGQYENLLLKKFHMIFQNGRLKVIFAKQT